MPRPTRSPARDLHARLEPIRDAIDRLCHEASLTPLSHQDYDRIEERAVRAAEDLRAAVRGVRPAGRR